ncbi:MAG: HAMP domain-containing sensor histidine kinase [Halovenus sp.]
MGGRLNYGGFVVAGLAFFLTRFTVTLALYENPVQFYLAGVVPLVVGLGLAAFGMALAVADVDPAMVRTTTVWCVVGFGTMLVLVVLTLLGSSTDGVVDLTTVRSQTYLSNFLIGGSIGGTLTGLYASRNRRQRSELQQQTNRLVTLNRLLRHEILNAVAAIRGYASVDPSENPEGMTVIDERAKHIEQTIEEVKYLTERTGSRGSSRVPRDLGESLCESVETIRDRYPNASVSVDSIPADLIVYTNERLPLVFTHLLENAIVHGNDDAPTVTVETTPTTVSVRIDDRGPGLPETQQSLLETGDIEEFDNPNVGFGLNIVRLLVESYGGHIDTDVGNRGTTVTVTLPQVTTDVTNQGPTRSDLTGVRPAAPHLVVTCLAAVVAGIAYGITSELLGGSVAGIGIFYGTVDPVIGWLTHEFHSIVFGFMYVGILSISLTRYRDTVGIYVIIGVVWSIVVWAVAASFVAPVWLRLVDIPATVPNFSRRLLVSHLAWGLSLGALTSLGYRYVVPSLTDRTD